MLMDRTCQSLFLACRQTITRSHLTLTSDERDKLAHTLLHALFRFLGDFSVFRKREFHDASHCSRCEVSIVPRNWEPRMRPKDQSKLQQAMKETCQKVVVPLSSHPQEDLHLNPRGI